MRNTNVKRILAALLSAVMISVLIPAAALADDPQPGTQAPDITVYLTVSDEGQIAADRDGKPMAWREVTASDLNEDGYVTFDEALRAAHVTFCPEGVAGLDINETSGWVNMLWGKTSAAGYSFIRNNKAEMSMVTDTVLSEGDHLTASLNTDTTLYADWNAYFDKYEVKAGTNEKVKLTLAGYQAMTVNTPAPAKNVAVGIWEEDVFTKKADTDENGAVSLTFDKAGTYIVTAQGTVSDMVYDWSQGQETAADCPLIAPVCVVKVTLSAADRAKAAQVKGLKVTAGKKKATVRWTKNTKVFSGYQIYYKQAGKSAKKVKINKKSAASKVIKKLKSKKRYTFKVRGFAKADGRAVYGKWSASKTVKIK